MINEFLAGFFRDYRRVHSLTQEGFAERIGLTPNHVGRIERNESVDFKISTIDQISTRLNIDKSDLFMYSSCADFDKNELVSVHVKVSRGRVFISHNLALFDLNIESHKNAIDIFCSLTDGVFPNEAKAKIDINGGEINICWGNENNGPRKAPYDGVYKICMKGLFVADHLCNVEFLPIHLPASISNDVIISQQEVDEVFRFVRVMAFNVVDNFSCKINQV